MLNGPDPAPRNVAGGVWLLADMSLNIFALSIVKALGLDYPVAQIVFLRAIVGLVVIAPWANRSRHVFAQIDSVPLHVMRVVFSTLALTAGFYAIARLPFALFTAISFTRPAITMILAVVVLREVVTGSRWIAALISFVGVLVAVQPTSLVLNAGLPAMAVAVLFGTSAIIVTRMLAAAPTVVMMVFYTAGLAILSAPIAAYQWTTIASAHLVPLLAIGAFAQCAQFCFLKAHGRAEAGFLAIVGYSSLVLTTGVGYFVFNEVPSINLILGASLIVAAATWTTVNSRRF